MTSGTSSEQERQESAISLFLTMELGVWNVKLLERLSRSIRKERERVAILEAGRVALPTDSEGRFSRTVPVLSYSGEPQECSHIEPHNRPRLEIVRS